ncbi:hypothetical protein ABG768_013472 [Culter alburnus]|uniref:Uncharacterized protein n=1 Tax=Culter alburnus TaxID=194366 RepID=A0AAW2B280_CULAL
MGAMRKALLFCLFLASVSSVKEHINNTNELKKSGYGSASPRHGLQLLFWFAQRVDVDQNNQFHLNFTPDQNAYGFHYFGNGEELLPPLNPGQTYYSFSKLSGPSANKFPGYVLKYYPQKYNTITEKQEKNMDRLVVSLDNKTKRRIFRVFITAHNPGSNYFNPNETYEIDLALILQIRKSYCNYNVIFKTTQHYDGDDEEEEKRCLQFLTATGYVCTTLNKRRMKRSPYPQCNAYEGIKLEIKTTTQGYAKLIWENIPADIMKNNKYIYIDICQNTHSSDSEVHALVRKQFYVHKSSGALDTSVSLNAEFDGANRAIPTRIKGLDASLQLYVGHGKACARLYIEKTFSKWEDVLYYSWVGFYKSSQDENDDYYTYQYAVKFPKINNYITDNYEVYQYNSSLTIAPGVQIRFLLDKKYNNVLAQTTPWERNQQVTSVCDKGNEKPSST